METKAKRYTVGYTIHGIPYVWDNVRNQLADIDGKDHNEDWIQAECKRLHPATPHTANDSKE